MIRAFIMAAGKGTRMWPLTENRPKALIPILNKPILQHILDAVIDAGISKITILVGYKGDRIIKMFGENYRDSRITYEYQEVQKGTGDAVKYLRKYPEKKFLILNGDIIFEPSIVRELMREDTAVTAVMKENAEDYGLVVGEEYLARIEEKRKGARNSWVNAGIYLLPRDIVECECGPSPRGEYELVDMINILAKKINIKILRTNNYWFDLAYPWHVLDVTEFLLKIKKEFPNEGEIEENVVIRGGAEIGKNTRILSGTYIEGPVIIGSNCKIGPNAYIRPYSVIGNNCHIGNVCEIKSSVIMDHSKIPHFNYVGDSIIGENCNLGAGTKIANLRLDEKNVKVYVKGQLIDTNRRKLGVITGDNVHTGINSSIDVGTFIGSNVFIGPAATVKGIIKSNTKIF